MYVAYIEDPEHRCDTDMKPLMTASPHIECAGVEQFRKVRELDEKASRTRQWDPHCTAPNCTAYFCASHRATGEWGREDDHPRVQREEDRNKRKLLWGEVEGRRWEGGNNAHQHIQPQRTMIFAPLFRPPLIIMSMIVTQQVKHILCTVKRCASSSHARLKYIGA